MKESLALYPGFGLEIFNYRTNLMDTKYLTKIFPSVKRAGLRARKLDAPLLINLSIYEKLREKLRIILSKRQVRKQSEVRDNELRPKNVKTFSRSSRSEILNNKGRFCLL